MAFERERHLSGADVPDLDRPIEAGRGNASSVGAKRHTTDAFGVSLERERHPSGAGVPDLDRLIVTGGGDASSVGAERHAHDAVGVSLERPQVGMAKPIEVEPFEAAEIGLALPGPFTLQEIQHPADVGVIQRR